MIFSFSSKVSDFIDSTLIFFFGCAGTGALSAARDAFFFGGVGGFAFSWSDSESESIKRNLFGFTGQMGLSPSSSFVLSTDDTIDFPLAVELFGVLFWDGVDAVVAELFRFAGCIFGDAAGDFVK